MTNTKEILKAFVFVLALFAVCGLSVWVAVRLDMYWTLFIVIPIIVIIAIIIAINSTVSIKCSNCGKEVGIRTGGFASLWLAEKQKKCQWCGHEAV